jgi:hypothetical protein
MDLFTKRSKLYKDVFLTEAGKKVLHDLSLACGAYISSYSQGDALEMARREGRREIYNEIMKLIDANLEVMHRIHHENQVNNQLTSLLD